ncbi:hypothetical protein DSM104299_02498 [Baekduia alba]|uniref:hypothetical protein n=1 Tax=Baekduia alba TaxID=2997333 RepID=UPI002340F1A4|nr:hypothetical protein [Baekduia alba]WCB93782.1 hypothetical protein DSM104299_02498 [Baekduia alba]
MSRRVLAVLAACCVAALSVTAVAFAHGGGSSGDKPAAHAKHHTGLPASFLTRGPLAASVTSLAQRLGVDPRALRTAIRAVVKEQLAEQRKAPRKAKPDLTALKADLATSLAAKLGKTPDEVLAAVRAELDARLTQAVQAGWLTQKGHDLALACFDVPASCDVKALKGEVRVHGHKPESDTSTGGGSGGRMTPGGRSTSTPLR